jgi:hypothetical protein
MQGFMHLAKAVTAHASTAPIVAGSSVALQTQLVTGTDVRTYCQLLRCALRALQLGKQLLLWQPPAALKKKLRT